MRIVKNEQLIKRNSRIGQFTSLGGMIALVGGMFVSIRYPQQISIALGALLVGFILTQVSLYLGNRFGRSPRPDESLDASLKGLPGDFTIYHYTTPASHLLVGPAGVWVLLPYRQAGKISFQNNRWRLKGGGFVQNYMRLFGQEGLGRPEADAQAEVRAVQKEFARMMEEGDIPPVQAALVFTNEQAEIDPADSPLPGLKPKQLKELLRQKAKEKVLSTEQIQRISAALE